MSCIISLIISIINIGLVSDIVNIWLSAWSSSFLIALPAVVIVSPLVHKFVDLLLKG